MKNFKIVALLLLAIPCVAQDSYPALETVDYVEIKSYMGKWHELYRLPNSFEKDCGNVTAEYSLKSNAKVSVVNTCKKMTTGKISKVNGTACVEDKATNAKLAVSFVPFVQKWCWFAGDYNIIALGDDYNYALVGSEDRQYLWILSRTKVLPKEVIQKLKKEAKRQNFKISKLIKTPMDN